MTDTWFRATGLGKRYGGIIAVDSASITLRRGEVRGLIGANGAGKSTLVKMLTGQVRPDTGTVSIDDSPVDLSVAGAARRNGIELMPQELTIAPHLSVAENVVLGREFAKGPWLDGRSQARAAEEGLARIGAQGLRLDQPAGDLTLVQQRLVMAARAVLNGSRMVVLDEPTAAMSAQEVALLMDMVRALSVAGVSCLYVSHRLDEIIELADGVTAMRDGRIVADLFGDEVTHGRLVELITAAAPVTSSPRDRRSGVAGPVLLSADNLSTKGLDGATFGIRQGEIVGVAGLIGSGVEQLIGIVSGSLAPTAGSLSLNGRRVPMGKRRAAARAGIGYLPGDRTLVSLPNHPVRENVTVASLGQYSRRGFTSASRERAGIPATLRKLGYTRGAEVTISTLSGGNQQKALVARWIVEHLTLLVLDDPTVGVDIGARAEIHAHLREVVAGGVGCLLYSSDMEELVALSDRVLVFDRGRCVAEYVQPDVTADQILEAMTGKASSSAVTEQMSPAKEEAWQ